MDSTVELNVFLVGGSVLQAPVLESSLQEVLKSLSENNGTVTALNGLVVKASQVAAYQVVR